MNQPQSDSDKEWVQAVREGKRAVFNKLVLKYQKKVLYLAYDLLGDYEDAKDVAQDAFIRAYEKIYQFEERSQFSTWLYRITVNLAMDLHRRRKRRPVESFEEHFREIEQTKSEDAASQPDELLQTSAQRHHIDSALQKLSDHQRIAVVLKYFQHKSSKEIAELLGCSENTVRIHLFRALRNLRKHLEKVQTAL
ncbi:MAG: sigma-70 family RNA polymerase sigma factor [Calditrichaeota bacterium]|nr:MAG: sigma-70 family RNA polymerase sigma factor [Calditrichota bacterium]